MAKWQSSSHWRGTGGRRCRKSRRGRSLQESVKKRSLSFEPFEERVLLAVDGPVLLAVIPSTGIVIEQGTQLTVAPRELLMRFDESIDPNSLFTGGVASIQFTRGGDHQLDNGNDVVVTPGYIGIGSNPFDVVVRFDENLPDDLYRMTVVGAGSNALKDTGGTAFNGGENLQREFTLELGAQVEAVVPQPITRGQDGKLTQAVNRIDVYFNVNDPLNQQSAQKPEFYQLFRTLGTASSQDDQVFNPTSVSYSASSGKAVLMFATNVLTTAGTYRLRIGTNEPRALAPMTLNPGFAGTSFDTAAQLGTGGNPFQQTIGTQTVELTDIINNVPTPVLFPGSPLEPGERDPVIEEHVMAGSNNGAIPVFYYNFQSEYGNVLGQPVFNLITEPQKQRVREVMSFYSYYLGVEFVESATLGFTIVTGDVRAVGADLPPTGIGGIADGSRAIMNSLVDWGASEPSGAYFVTAMHEIGHLLGLGHDYAAPAVTVQGSASESALGASLTAGEPVFPGDHDILYGRYLWPALGNDINVYKFSLQSTGLLNIETFAERLRSLGLAANPSQLDSVLTLYDAAGKIIARNDDYYGKDSFIQLQLTSGTYYVAVTSTGNTNFDPSVTNSGFGGTTQGGYQLRLTFTPTVSADNSIVDTAGTPLDGDRDGLAGGVSNFWFKSDVGHTLYVDKASTGGTGTLGSITNPYTTISSALAAATPGSIVRIVGNGGADGLVGTVDDNLSYNVGFNSLLQPLSDGSKFEVPRGVTVMIDAGAIIKLRAANVDVGSSAQGIDRSAGVVQVLGTTAKDVDGRDVGSVYFTSYYNDDIGTDPGTAKGLLAKGNWGGLVFRNDSDLESAGIFLNYVNHAKLSYGGGQVSVNSVLAVYTPIHLETARPTITYNEITSSADSAISGDPNSFEENEFVGPGYHADYSRVGPRIYGNVLSDNSINGLFIRIRTLNGSPLDPLTVNARFAATDIVHVLNEVLLVRGQPGGFLREEATGLWTARPSARLAIDPGIVMKMGGGRIETGVGAEFLAEGTIDRPIIFTSVFDDRYGGGGISDTTNDTDSTTPQQGNWGGFLFGPTSFGSIDRAVVTFAGGQIPIEGGFDTMDPVEIHQAQVRITNTLFDRNKLQGGGDRNGRNPADAAVIFIRGAQPVILNNTFQNNFGSPSDGVFVPNEDETKSNPINSGAVISVNVNALNSVLVNDWGRSRGRIALAGSYPRNTGPLIRNNLVGNNTINGMVVRGGTITTDVIWDDTDIVHVVRNSIAAGNQQSLSGTLRMQSSSTESLVVKILGIDTDIIADGKALDIADRTGGSVQIVGTASHPVVLTSLKDDTVGAGLTPEGLPQTDTLNRKGVLAPEKPILATQGPVILDAAARDVHGSSWAFLDGWDTLLREVDYVFHTSGITPAEGNESTILIIGLDDDPTLGRPYWREAIEWVASQLGLTTFLRWRPSEIASVNFYDYKMVYIPTHSGYLLPDLRDDPYVDTKWWGGITDGQLSVLNDRKATLQDYINNNGGGLLAMAQDTAVNPKPYAFISSPDQITLRASGGNVMTATEFAPPEWAQYNINDNLSTGVLNVGTPYRAAFKGPTGYDRLLPLAVDPVTGEVAMLGTMPGAGPGIGPPRDIVAPGDWGSVRLDVLSNDRNVEVVNELERGFTTTGDTNQLPTGAEFLGELAKDQLSGDDNVRLGFEIFGNLSQAANSPGGADVDTYSFRGTAGTTVWMDIDRTASSLDSVVELVDANGAVIARSDNSIAESAGTEALVGSAKLMALGEIPGDPSPFATRDFYTSNPKDPGMRVILPGTTGTVNTYFVRVRSSSPNLAVLAGGVTKGSYVLQLRLQELDEYPGSTVRYADIRYANNGIEVIGKPERSPLVSNTTQGDPASGVGGLSATQDLGNLLGSDRVSITASGDLASSADVDVYRFTLSEAQVQSIGGLSDGLKTFATMLRINYADGLVRPDTTLSLYSEDGTLLMVAKDSQLVDALPRPNTGGDTTNLGHQSYGVYDPTIGPVQLPSGAPGNDVTYYVAVSSASLLPAALSATYTMNASTNPLIRLEPVDSIARISEDHLGFSAFSTAETPAQLFPGGSASALNQFADPYQLGDVVLFVNTTDPVTHTDKLRMVDPFTGAQLSTSNTSPLLQVPMNELDQSYPDIAMRNDGRLFSLTQGTNVSDTGNYVEFNTNSGLIVNGAPDDNLSTYNITQVDPPPPMTPMTFTFSQSGNGIQYEALTFLQTDDDTDRRLFAIGNRGPTDTGDTGFGAVAEQRNLLYELDPDTGEAITRLPSGAVWRETTDSGSGTDAVPIGHFPSISGRVQGIATVTTSGTDRLFLITSTGALYEADTDWDEPQPNVIAYDTIDATFRGQLPLPSGAGIESMTVGPQHVEGGEYATTLFAIDGAGNLYAFNTSGALAPVFAGGQSIVATGLSNVEGLAFSSLDYNLWHTTLTRDTDLGHGISQVFDGNSTRVPGLGTPNEELIGGGSFYFGLEAPSTNPLIPSQPGADAYVSNPELANTYGLPGGAYGSITSNTFSLEGYTSFDLPTLYFNYLLDTGNVNSTMDDALDVMRVQISSNGVTWQPLATSNVVLGTGSAENPTVLTPQGGQYRGLTAKQTIQGLFESDETLPGDPTKVWRQARVDLGDYAGQSNLRLRFQFSTAGSMGSGSVVSGTGTVIQALAGSQLRDGDTFAIRQAPTFSINDATASAAAGASQMAFTVSVSGTLTQPVSVNYRTADGTAVDGVNYTAKTGTLTFVPGGPTSQQIVVPILSNPVTGAPKTFSVFLEGRDQATVVGDFQGIGTIITQGVTVSNPVLFEGAGPNFAVFDVTLATPAASLVTVTYSTANGTAVAGSDYVPTTGTLTFLPGTQTQSLIVQTIGDQTAENVEKFVVNVAASSGGQGQGVATILNDDNTFTFRSGLGLTVPTGGGAVIADGATLVVNGVTFEFNKPGTPPVPMGNVGISINNQQSAAVVAQAIANQIFLTLGLTTRVYGARIEVPGAASMSSTAVTVTGSPIPALLAPSDIVINGDLSAAEVARAMAAALDRVYSAGTDDPNIFQVAKVSDDQLRLFVHGVASTGPLSASAAQLPGDGYGDFDNTTRDRHVVGTDGFEGIYLDDFIIGLASRGEMVTNAVLGDIALTEIPRIPGEPTRILSGPYQLEIGVTDRYGSVVDSNGHIELSTTWNVNDRFARGFTIVVPPGSQLFDGQTFRIDDGANPLTFEFDMNGQLSNAAHVRVTVAQDATAANVATAIVSAITGAVNGKSFKVRASTAPNGNRVDLFDALNVIDDFPGALSILSFGTPDGVTTTGQSDVRSIYGQNQVSFAPGQTIIQNSSVSDSRQVGIQVVPLIGQIFETGVAFTQLSNFPVGLPGKAGSIANLPTANTKGWVPGVTVKNNLVVASGRTGIEIGGDPNVSYGYSQLGDKFANLRKSVEQFLSFARVVNNTVHDAKVGIAAANASSPTIINNIISDSGVALTAIIRIPGPAIYVDDSSGAPKDSAGVFIRFGESVVGANLYQGNAFNLLGTSDSNAIILPGSAPLYVDKANRNFYLAAGALAIDSSVNSVQDRPALTSATLPLGMPLSPIQAPEFDLLGQLRVDDPSVTTPPGLGSNVFKDRGAIERADFLGPTAEMAGPIDNDPEGIDRDPANNHLVLLNAQLTEFAIQLLDGVGVGIDDATVDSSKFTVQRTVAGTTTTLVRDVDYTLAYDTNSDIARLIPAQGIWLNGVYTITLNNGTAPIKDLAGNSIQANEPPDTHFVIELTDNISSGWQNPDNKFDVNADGKVSTSDLLAIVNSILTDGLRTLPVVADVPPYLDVSGDGKLTTSDALQLINEILRIVNSSAEPAAEPLFSTTTTLDGDLSPAAPAAADADAIAFAVAMSEPAAVEQAEYDALWEAGSDSPTTTSAADAPLQSQLMEGAGSEAALSATMETTESDYWDSELDSILDDLTGDAQKRVFV